MTRIHYYTIEGMIPTTEENEEERGIILTFSKDIKIKWFARIMSWSEVCRIR